MKFLFNMRISHKISALMIGLVLGFILIGVTYYLQIGMNDKSRMQEREAFSYQNTLVEIGFLQGRMQTAASQFFAGKNPVYAEQYEQFFTEIDEKLKQARATSSAYNVTKPLTSAADNLSQHKTIFTDAKNEVERYGVFASSGLRGQLSGVSREIETLLNRNPAGDTLSAFFAIRQAESDYLTTGMEVDQNAVEEQLNTFENVMESSILPPSVQRTLEEHIQSYRETLNQIAQSLAVIREKTEELTVLETGITQSFAEALATSKSAMEKVVATETTNTQMVNAVVTAIIFAVAMGTAIGIYLIYKSIIFPMTHIQSVIKRINRGKMSSRVKVMNDDELGELGSAFNKLLDERIQQLEEQSRENDKLNNSIISLIQALGRIARKDLTIKVPVSADITGTISDAVNLLTSETAKTLHQVKDVSREVDDVSTQLQTQSESVIQFAENERRQIVATSKALEILARAMNDVAKRSEIADRTANQAIESTQSARQTVVETVNGIRAIRETISETEKRIKRLGERSQEISGIVNLINTIAERTHILALNASMHAASAGEAGKGFAVVADEVQRLAESARESTDEISSMVNNIRVETSDTVAVMNTLISQVAEGSRLAEQAGERMEATEKATRHLVENVKIIADQATQQADVANRVRDRATIIRNFTEKTGQQLAEQKRHTDSLKHYAEILVERVSVFVLPEDLEKAPKASLAPVSKLQSAS